LVETALLHFSFALHGLQKMDLEFACSTGFIMTLISFIFLAPALLALGVMLFILSHCRRSSSHCAELFLI